jgi:hypothetical protein
MAITFVNENDLGGFGTSLTVTVPSGVVDHDVMVLHAQNPTAFNALAGWTSLGTNTVGGYFSQFWWRLAASEPASYTLTWSSSSPTTTGTIAAYRGADITAPVHASAIAGGTTQTFAAPTITTLLQCMIVTGALNNNTAFSSGPAGYTKRSAAIGVWLADQSAVAAGSISPGNYATAIAPPEQFSAYTVALTLPNTPMVMLV